MNLKVRCHLARSHGLVSKSVKSQTAATQNASSFSYISRPTFPNPVGNQTKTEDGMTSTNSRKSFARLNNTNHPLRQPCLHLQPTIGADISEYSLEGHGLSISQRVSVRLARTCAKHACLLLQASRASLGHVCQDGVHGVAPYYFYQQFWQSHHQAPSSLAQLVARSAVTRFRHISDTELHSIPEG